MSFIITSLLVAGGVVLGRWIAKSSPKKQGDEAADKTAAGATQKNAGAAPSKEQTEGKVTEKEDEDRLFDGFPCTLGDVVMKRGLDQEAWLAGAIVLSEQAPVGAIFVAPEAGKDIALYARPQPHAATLVWLEQLAPGELAMGTEPPTSIEHAGLRFDRARRLPVRVKRAGAGAPDAGERAIVAEYTTPGPDRLVVLLGAQATLAWRGVALEEGMYEVLPGGKSNLP